MSDHQIASSIPVEGELVQHTVAGVKIAQIHQVDSQVGEPLLTLHHSELVTMHGAIMLLKGEEWPDGNARKGFLQEWSIRFE